MPKVNNMAQLTKEQESIVEICHLLRDTISELADTDNESQWWRLSSIRDKADNIILSYEPNA